MPKSENRSLKYFGGLVLVLATLLLTVCTFVPIVAVGESSSSPNEAVSVDTPQVTDDLGDSSTTAVPGEYADGEEMSQSGTESEPAVPDGSGAVTQDEEPEEIISEQTEAQHPAADTLASGTCGECTWTIDTAGLLIVSPTNGVTGQLTNGGYTAWPWREYKTGITEVRIEEGVIASSSLAYMFYECNQLTSADLSGLDTSQATNMAFMFSLCSNLIELDLSTFDTSNVTNMGSMFSNCYKLTSLDLSSFDTSHVTNMQLMFLGCDEIELLDLSTFDTSSATNMNQMFDSDGPATLIRLGDGFSFCGVYEQRQCWLSTNGCSWISLTTGEALSSEEIPNNVADTYATTRVEKATISGLSDEMYSGVAIEPKPVVTVGPVTLVEGRDYHLSYSSNTWPGTATVTVSGNADLDYRRLSFQILPGDVSTATITGLPDIPYSGSATTPFPVVTVNGRVLRVYTDYTLTYENNVNAGTATVSITGTGYYTGSKTATFQIVQSDISQATVTGISDRSYTGHAVEPIPAVKIGKRRLELGTDYALEYEDNVDLGTATVVIKGIGNYTGTKTVEFQIVPADIAGAAVEGISDRVYTGHAIEPNVTVVAGLGVLQLGVDYELSYSNNVNAGTATITITGKGNYSGTRDVTFKITRASISGADVTVVATRTYTGSALRPAPVVKLGGVTLKSGTDYSLTYKNNTTVGTATITITGKGSYTGTKTVTFKITRASISGATVAKIADKPYTGSAIKPSPKVTMVGRTLVKDTDYTLSYSNNVRGGTATITITGKGNYSGTKTATFRIVAPSVTYRVHVQTYGWQSWRKDGAAAGTSGESKRLEGINIKLASAPYSGGITYRVHVQRIGWQGWRSDGAMAGTSGQSLRLEAIQIKLTGDMAAHYDVYYRVHAQHFGWMGWAKNGQSAGTAGYAYRLEAIEIVIVPKGAPAPGPTANAFRQKK